MTNTFALLCSLLLPVISIVAAIEPVLVEFTNDLPHELELFWINPDDDTQLRQGVIEGNGDRFRTETYPNHEFAYSTPDGVEHRIKVSPFANTDEGVVNTIMILPDAVFVRCETSVNGGSDDDVLDIILRPRWSPWGAQRFLELVKERYYDGCALNRVVPQFLSQFGIGADYDARTASRKDRIPDDPPQGIQFRPGYMSFAGSGIDSRTSEVFIVMPGISEDHLEYLGLNIWETPFAEVDLSKYNGDASLAPMTRWHAYGDMPPWGEGPDPQLVYAEDGYDYLKENFPALDYIKRCYVVEKDTSEDTKKVDL